MSDPSYIDELATYRQQAAEALSNPQRLQNMNASLQGTSQGFVAYNTEPVHWRERARLRWWEIPLLALVLLVSGLVWTGGLWLIWVALTIVLS